MGAPNWGRLFIEWRCKAIWVPFSDEEMEAIKSWVSPQDIQNGKWKSKVEVKETWDEKVEDTEKSKEVKETWDEKEIKKQLKQTLRNRGISFTNFDTIEKLQEKLQANL